MALAPKKFEMLGSDSDFLRLKKKPVASSNIPAIRMVDLFCGCGGMSLGFEMAAIDLGFRAEIPLAVDMDSSALACYKKNFPKANTQCADVTQLFELDWKAELSQREIEMRQEVGQIDILVGGPPCQGHSDLNNYTRRNDPKNQLMQVMARAAIVLKPRTIVIENVIGSLKDSEAVVYSVESIYKNLGYKVSVGILDFAKLGVPQRRKRMIMVATLEEPISVEEIQSKYPIIERDLAWAIKDLMELSSEQLVDKVALSQKQTKQRIDFLFDNNIYELPNEQRPACHRDKSHSYNTVYGRLRWNNQSQTITSGFYSMCMGRYVHPEKRRTLTAHEAARIQFFPDFFDFSPANTRTNLAVIIGNAVPPKGAYVIARSLLQSLEVKK